MGGSGRGVQAGKGRGLQRPQAGCYAHGTAQHPTERRPEPRPPFRATGHTRQKPMPEPGGRNPSRGRVSRNRRMKPRARGVPTRRSLLPPAGHPLGEGPPWWRRALCLPDICRRRRPPGAALRSGPGLVATWWLALARKTPVSGPFLLPCFLQMGCGSRSLRAPPRPPPAAHSASDSSQTTRGGPRCRRPRHPAEASRLVLAVPLLACSPTVSTWRPPTRRCPSVLPLQKAAPREELPLCIPGPALGLHTVGGP